MRVLQQGAGRRVLLRLPEAHRERYECQPTPEALVLASHNRLVVRDENDLVRRLELEELAVEEASGDAVAAGQFLQRPLG